MFCFNCGSKVDAGARFCAECGVRLIDDVPAASPAPVSVESPVPTEEKAAAKKRGFLLTNVRLLAQKFGVPAEDVLGVLDAFIREKKRFGVHYELLDAGDYAFRCCSRRVSLVPQNDVVDFLDILLDAHNAEIRRGEPESTYLFIVGGNDIIPMPRGPNYSGTADPDTDADLLYAFPYGREAVEALYNATIFVFDALFYLGRLPFGPDSEFSDFQNYMSNAVAAAKTDFSGGPAYSQSDPHWKNMSAFVATSPRAAGMFPRHSVTLPEEAFFKDIFLTPPICEEGGTTKSAFYDSARLYYFNLHGSSARKTHGYSGEQMRHSGNFFPGIEPDTISRAQALNFVVTESCYGGRFIDYSTGDSMVLSALAAKTVIYLASSRVAWGGFGNGSETMNAIGCADLLCAAFMEELLRGGKDAGTALFCARRRFFQKKDFSPEDLTTIVEFNLFGDPTIGFYPSASKSALPAAAFGNVAGAFAHGNAKFVAVPSRERRSFAPKSAKIGFAKERVSDDGNGATPALLERVRAQVNANLAQIRESVNKHLYENYGVKPRALSSIFRVKYADGREEMSLTYKMSENEIFKPGVTVRIDSRRNVKSVLMTK